MIAINDPFSFLLFTWLKKCLLNKGFGKRHTADGDDNNFGC